MNKVTKSQKKIDKSYKKTDSTGLKYFLNNLKKTGLNSRREDRENLFFPITAPDGSSVFPKSPDEKDGCWRWSKEKVKQDNHLIEWKKTKRGWSVYYRVYAVNNPSEPPDTIWKHASVGSNRESKLEARKFNGDDIFPTPKPERLIQCIIHLATNPGDLVLDSFAGSGTTGAVAHKMGRKWIMIEMEDTVHTHIIPRMEKVISGEDQGGISQALNWKGGGGFRFCELAPSLMEKNRWNRWSISKKYNPAMLAEAMCLHSGFTYSPREYPYWVHGFSTEHDHIYVTSMELSRNQLAQLSDEVGDSRSLLVYCASFRVEKDEFHNLTIKKIPKTILNKCEWGRGDYSLSLKSALKAEAEAANKKKSYRSSESSYTKVPMAAKGGSR